jgi:hypothetical protein
VARFEAGPAKANGGWRIDTLFQFRPFQFVATFEAGLDVRVKGFSVSVTLHGKIKGPSPVHVRGKLNIDLPGPVPDPSPKVHITLGEKKQKDDAMPTANVLEELSEAVAEPGNWSAQLPENGRDLVTLRDIETDDSTVLAHPMGRLSVRQTVVPLNEPIEKYGQNRPIHETFDIEVSSDGASDSEDDGDSTPDADELPAMSDLQESFAPSKFEKMSDSERMNAPSFRKMNAGREVTGDLFHWGCWAPEDEETETPDNAASAELLYESSREGPFPEEGIPGDIGSDSDSDSDSDSTSTSTDGGPAEATDHRPAYPPQVSRALSDDGSVANAEHRRTGERKFVPDGSQVDRVAFRSNYGRLLDPIAVLADPTVLDDRPDTGSVTAATGGWSG